MARQCSGAFAAPGSPERADTRLIGQYVLMPDHLHLFAAPNPVGEGEAPAEPRSFDSWVRYWKSQFTKHHGKASAMADRSLDRSCDGRKATLTSGSMCATIR